MGRWILIKQTLVYLRGLKSAQALPALSRAASAIGSTFSCGVRYRHDVLVHKRFARAKEGEEVSSANIGLSLGLGFLAQKKSCNGHEDYVVMEPIPKRARLEHALPDDVDTEASVTRADDDALSHDDEVSTDESDLSGDESDATAVTDDDEVIVKANAEAHTKHPKSVWLNQ